MHIVLVEPEIPANTGNISRTCAVTGTPLHLVKPLGFEVDDKHLKRAGLDYWDKLDLTYYENWQDFAQRWQGCRMIFASSHGTKGYHEIAYQPDDFLVFGKETKGLPKALLDANPETTVRIPMREGIRCLNLSNSVAVVLYEALRQQGFIGLT